MICGRDNVREGGIPSLGASGRTKAHHLPRGADARASRRISFRWRPFRGPRRAPYAAAHRRQHGGIGGLHLDHRPHLHRQNPRAHMKKLREFHADAHPASRRPADLRADRRTAGLHPALRFALRRSGARQRAARRRAVPAARRGLRPQRRISGAEPRMLRPNGHIERNRQTGLRHGPHVRRAGTFRAPGSNANWPTRGCVRGRRG